MKLALCIMGLLVILCALGIWKLSQPVRQIQKVNNDIHALIKDFRELPYVER